jgi:hypothetical protein
MENEFSGFEEDEVPEINKKNKEERPSTEGRLKSLVVKPGQSRQKENTNKKLKSTKKGNKASTSSKAPNKGSKFDLNSLSNDDLEILKAKLGISQCTTNSLVDNLDDIENEHVDLNSAPNMHIELSNDSEYESVDSIGINRVSKSKQKDLSKRLINSLFGEASDLSEDENEWLLPKIKTKNKGDPVASSLAKAINVACTNQCDTDSLCDKYVVPENCEMLNPPSVNNEIWKVLDKRARSYDCFRKFRLCWPQD